MSYFEEDPLADIIGNEYLSDNFLNSDGTLQLEIYKDDIENFTVIPFSLIRDIQKHYIIISLSPQLIHKEGETFASLVFKLKDKESLV